MDYVSTGLTQGDDKNHLEYQATGQALPEGMMMITPKVDHFPRWHQSPRLMDTYFDGLRIHRPHTREMARILSDSSIDQADAMDVPIRVIICHRGQHQ
jgi:hypothetical protein